MKHIDTGGMVIINKDKATCGSFLNAMHNALSPWKIWKWEIKNLTKLVPLPPFSFVQIISDKKYLGENILSVSLSFKYLVRVETPSQQYYKDWVQNVKLKKYKMELSVLGETWVRCIHKGGALNSNHPKCNFSERSGSGGQSGPPVSNVTFSCYIFGSGGL